MQGCLLQLLVATAIVTTHPFPSLALVVFAFSYFVLAQKNRQTYFVLFSAVFSVGWFLFNGTRTFQDAIDRTKTFFSPQYIAPLAKTVTSSENSPWWGVALRDLFKYSLVALLAVASLSTLIILYQKLTHHKNEGTSVALSSLLPMAITILLGLLLLPDWGISRFTAFAAFPAAFASFTLIDNLIMKDWEKRLSHRKFFNKRAFGALLLCGIVALSASVMVLRFERNYYFGEATHPIELSSLSFFFNHDDYSEVNILSWRTTVYSAFFNFNQSHVTLRLWYKDVEGIGGNLSKLLLYEGQFINQSHSVIRGMRDAFDLGLPSTLLNTIDDEMILPRFNRVYSNGNYTIYSRP
jgi:uncharacterized membrane protein YgdD (TMEM256/DUF423 family)